MFMYYTKLALHVSGAICIHHQECKQQSTVAGTGHSMSSEPNFQHSDPIMKLSTREAKIMNSFGDFLTLKKVGFLKIQI
jgi:hypothetical protein